MSRRPAFAFGTESPRLDTREIPLQRKSMSKTGLVVSAHPGDFVWRAGGAIALHARKGYRGKIVCLSFGSGCSR